MIRRVASIASALLLSMLVVAGAGAGAKDPPKVGDVPPESLGKTSDGERVKLSNYRGKVVIISFWASWCGPCRKELPTLAKVQEIAGAEQLQFFAINSGEPYERYRDIVRAFRKSMKDSPFKLISDEDGYYGKQYGVKGIPHLIIIGRDGKIDWMQEGYGEDEIPLLVDKINKLLAAPREAAGT
jgi:thiol-disulfide isomerase/thioredoxin